MLLVTQPLFMEIQCSFVKLESEHCRITNDEPWPLFLQSCLYTEKQTNNPHKKPYTQNTHTQNPNKKQKKGKVLTSN